MFSFKCPSGSSTSSTISSRTISKADSSHLTHSFSTTRFSTKMASNNYYLSPEVFVMIFKNLSFRDVVENCAKVCVQWESVVAQHFMQPFLVKVTNYDRKICRYLKNLGWSDECSDPEKIVSSFNMEKVKNYPGNMSI